MTQREAVLAFLREHPGATMNEIADGVGRPYYLVEPKVREYMLRDGEVVRESMGGAAGTPKWRYFLPNEKAMRENGEQA